MDKKDSDTSATQEKYLLKTRKLVRQIVSRKLGRFDYDSIEDVEQRVFLKLWRWKSSHEDKELSEEEWLRFANTVTHNEVNDFLSSKHNRTISLSQLDEDTQEIILSNSPSKNDFQVNSIVETRSLLLLVWKLVQNLTFRQKYAYFLHQPDFIIDFIAAECCSMKELADFFEVTEEDFSVILEIYPLSDVRIGELLKKRFSKEFSIQSIWKARSQAKAAIAKKLAVYIFDERLSGKRKT